MDVVMIQTNPTAGPAMDLPAWMRRAAFDPETGTVFVPPGLANRGEPDHRRPSPHGTRPSPHGPEI